MTNPNPHVPATPTATPHTPTTTNPNVTITPSPNVTLTPTTPAPTSIFQRIPNPKAAEFLENTHLTNLENYKGFVDNMLATALALRNSLDKAGNDEKALIAWYNEVTDYGTDFHKQLSLFKKENKITVNAKGEKVLPTPVPTPVTPTPVTPIIP